MRETEGQGDADPLVLRCWLLVNLKFLDNLNNNNLNNSELPASKCLSKFS